MNLEGYRESQKNEEQHQKAKAEIEVQAEFLRQKYLSGPTKNISRYTCESISTKIIFDGYEYAELWLQRQIDPEAMEFFKKFEKHLTGVLGMGEFWRIERTQGDQVEAQNWDWNGHLGDNPTLWRSKEHIRNDYLTTKFGLLLHVDVGMPEENYQAIRSFMEDPSKPMDRFVAIEKPSCLNICYNCGQETQVETNGHELRLVGPCEHPDGYPAYSVEVDFPTGRVAVGNDFRPYFREAWVRMEDSDYPLKSNARRRDFNINQTLGCHMTALEYSHDNYLTGFCGNTCPGVWRSKEDPNRIIIGNPPLCDDEGGDLGDVGIEGGDRLTGICTDLWWFSLADMCFIEGVEPLYRLYDPEKGGCYLGTSDRDAENYYIIDVEPGRYRCTNFYHRLKEDYTKERIMAVIERVGDCEGTYE